MNTIEELNNLIVKLDKDLPKKILEGKEVFDFKESKVIPGVVCLVFYNNKLLIVKRSDQVFLGQGKWCVVTGSLDRLVPIEEIITEELQEEVNIITDDIDNVQPGKIIEIPAYNSNIKLITLIVRIDLKRNPAIKLNWENTEYAWITKNELTRYDFVSEFSYALDIIISEFK
jgi:8-oxo-dGTP pyrophosphatase MutT (NUDIX family)